MARRNQKEKASAIILWIIAIILAVATVFVVYSYSVSKSDIIADESFAEGLSEAMGKPAGKISAADLAEFETMSIQHNAYLVDLYAMYGIDTTGMDADGYTVSLTLPGYDSSIYTTEESTEEEIKAAEENDKLALYFETETLDYADFALFTGLKNASVYYDPTFDDVSVFSASADKLETLLVYSGALGDISAVASYPKLTSLSLGSNGISDISAVAGLTELTSLTLDDNAITDISAVAGLTKLETLALDNNAIEDISAVKNLTALKTLYLNGTGVTDLSFADALDNLEALYLDNNGIKDISALSSLDAEKIATLSLDGNEITDWAPVEAIKDKVVGYPEEETEAEDEAEAEVETKTEAETEAGEEAAE